MRKRGENKDSPVLKGMHQCNFIFALGCEPIGLCMPRAECTCILKAALDLYMLEVLGLERWIFTTPTRVLR